VAKESGQPVGFVDSGAVLAAFDGADLATLQRLRAFATGLGVTAELLTGQELHSLEPALAPGLPGAIHAPGDDQVDPRLLHAALFAACRARGVQIVESAGAVLTDHGQVRGVRVSGGQVLASRYVVVAAGSWSAHVEGMPAGVAPPVRPVKGQTPRIVRGLVKGSPVYLVPRPDGRIVVGASSEEQGFDVAPRAGAVYELLRDAQSLMPELGEAVLEEVNTGLRPGSPDNAPIIGPTAVAGLLHASGHYRNGILLTPVTADAVAHLVDGGTLPEGMAPFSPTRFAAAADSTSGPR
jgi:glycine oxidase